MGHIVVMDDSQAQLDLTRFSRSLWQQLIPTLPDNVEYETPGTLWVAADEEEMVEVHAKQSTYAARSSHRILSAPEVAAEEPNLRPGLAGGLLVPDDAVIYPPAAADWFLKQSFRSAQLSCRASAASAAKGELRLSMERLFTPIASCSRQEQTAPCCLRSQSKNEKATCSSQTAIQASSVTS